ncbi:TPA: tail fiber domain-containing protein [Bacillus cereus]|nr:tail fiber domain-containing protein [Bacillus cereus]
MPWGDDKRAGVIRFNRTNLAETAPNSIVNGFSTKFSVTLNQEYTFSTYMKVPNVATFKFKYAYIIEFFNEAGVRVQYQDVQLTADELADITTGKWTRIVRTIKPKTADIVSGGFRLALFHNGDIYYRMPQVELGDRVTGWNLSTDDFSTQHGLNDLTVKTNAIKQTVDSNQATITSLSTTQGNHTTQIQKNTSEITQLNNQISSKVSDTQMQDYVGGMGSTNLYMNSAFEDRIITPSSGIVTSRTPSLSKWKVVATVSGSAVTPTTARQHDGYNSAQIQATGLTVNAWTGISQLFPVTSSSGKLVLSAWVFTYNKDGLDQGGALEIKFLNGSTTVTTSSVDLKDKLNNGAWTLVSVIAEVPSKAVTHVEAYIWIRRNGLIWVSQPQFQQGATPSAFMENPKDYANYDQLVGEIAKKVATTDFNSKVSTLETSINQQSSRIDLKAEKTEVYSKTDSDGRYGSKAIVESHTSQLSVMSNEISSRVKAGEIASAINQTAQSVLIQASKINLDGAVTAKSIESGRLAGVTISTSTNSTGYFVDMNQQNISLKSNVGNTGPITRGYLGFMPNLSDNTVRTALVLGNNYDNTNRLEVNGSLFLEQQTPKWNNYDLSNCRIGMARSRNSDGSINMKSSIKMGYMGSIEMRSEDSDIDIDAKGHIRMNTTRGGKSLNDIQIISGTSMSLDAYNGSWFLNSSSSKGADDWRIRTLHINDKRSGGNTQADVDFRMGHLVTLRIPQHPDYTKYGMEVKNGTGTSLSNIHVDKVYLTQNMWESTRQVKTAIKEIKVDALETLMQLQPKQYYRKSEMQKLYEKREKIVAGKYQEPMPTIKDVPLEYGFIAEEMPECLATEDRKTVSAYPLMTIGIAGTQEVYKKHLALEEIVKEQANQLAIQEDRIARLEELLLQQLIDKKPEQP